MVNYEIPQVSEEYKRLSARSKGELEQIFKAGDTPAIEAMVGHEYRGYNHSKLTSLLRVQKFIKGFFKSEPGEFIGYNTPVKQNGLDGEWIPLPNDAQPKRFGFFRVKPVDPESRDNAYPHAVLLDYKHGPHKAYDLTKVLRDYVVRVEKGSDDLLLGKAYIALGPARVFITFFLLERHGLVKRD